MSKVPIIVIDPDELEARINTVVKDELWNKLPDYLRNASENEALTASQLIDEFSISYSIQKELRKTGQLSFERKGRTITYQRTEIIRWIRANSVKRDKN